jgi:hypothetical protein
MLFYPFLEGIKRFVIPQWERAGYSGLERGVNLATGNLVWKGTRSYNTTIEVHSLAYADEIVFVARDATQAKRMLEILHDTLSEARMEISTTKSAGMRLGTDTIGPQQQLCPANMGAIAHRRNSKYLGCVLSETAKDEVIVEDRIFRTDSENSFAAMVRSQRSGVNEVLRHVPLCRRLYICDVTRMF